MCNPPNDAIMRGVVHDSGATSAVAPQAMKAAPMTGTLLTEYVPALTTAAPYSNIHDPGRSAYCPWPTKTAVNTAPASIAGEKLSMSFLKGPEMSGTLAACDLSVIDATEIPAAIPASATHVATRAHGRV